ncbi:MAG: MFS transporter [Ignavibacteria bacterium]|nr:MFS transporter [Ignavibacteria bacterium]
MKYLTKTIILLSFVSFFTDIASEMLYPVMPLYLQSIGFSIVAIGILEGIAEAVSGLSKGYFGNLSDKKGMRLPFVRAGYALSAVSKPLIALFTNIYWVFTFRTLDRFGKGIRTGARDAILSDETTSENKGKVFGFHRSLDTFGAVLGPGLALIYLYFYPENYVTLFYLAFIPGIISIAFTFLIKEKKILQDNTFSGNSFKEFLYYFKRSGTEYKKSVAGFLAFAFFNSSDVFLLLMLKYKGYSDLYLIVIYIFYNLIYALSSFPFGIIADKIGLKKTFIIGLLFFAAAYLLIAFADNIVLILIVFAVYGLYAAGTEGISKAWISNIVPKSETATAIGTYTAFNSISLMLASFAGGLLWYNFSPQVMFIFSAAGAFLVALYFLIRK